MNFEISFCRNIIFKKNAINEIGKYVSNFGKKIIFIYSPSALKEEKKYDTIINSLSATGIIFFEINGISGEPSPEIIDKIVDDFSDREIEAVLAVGGGSVIDTAKAVAALLTNEKGIENYLEGVGSGKEIINEPLPVIAVPTTAGSGAEATKNAVITSYKKKYKKSFRDSRNIPKLILADSALTHSLSKEQTAAGGMDALCQLIESFISIKKNPYCRAFGSYFIPRAYKSLTSLSNNLYDFEARSVMLEASIASGISLANSGLGIVHGFASGLGGMFDIQHGLICAVILPHSIKLNSKKYNDLYSEISELIFENKNFKSETLAEKLFELNEYYGIPKNFKKYNIDKKLAKEIVLLSQGSSLKGNPVSFSDEELVDFIEELL